MSVTSFGGLVYVLNAGGNGGIAGFRLDDGALHRIAGSGRALSGNATSLAEVAFSSDGRFLVVTERATNKLDTYRLDGRGVAGAAITTDSSGPTPYGFAFDLRNHAIVSEATNSTVSSYRIGGGGASLISDSVPTNGLAACWVATTPNGRWAFDTNAHSGTISSFEVHLDGSISLAHSIAASTGSGSAPLDLAVNGNGRYLYVNEAGSNLLGGYRIGSNGTLTGIAGSPGLPAAASGLAAS